MLQWWIKLWEILLKRPYNDDICVDKEGVLIPNAANIMANIKLKTINIIIATIIIPKAAPHPTSNADLKIAKAIKKSIINCIISTKNLALPLSI